MSKQDASPQQIMASLFVGLSRHEQMALLGRLESAGAGIYRALAAEENNVKVREALLKAAGREEENGGLLRLMTTAKAGCEKCSKPLPVRTDAHVCSFQCTFCADCAGGMNHVCPNCGGALERAA
ncbi:MAG: DUF1272 domain-containing protein [Candidatus Binataceae bacterium]